MRQIGQVTQNILTLNQSIPAIFNDPANLDLSTMNDFVKQSLDDIHMGIGSNEVYFTIIKDDEFGDQVTTFSRVCQYFYRALRKF